MSTQDNSNTESADQVLTYYDTQRDRLFKSVGRFNEALAIYHSELGQYPDLVTATRLMLAEQKIAEATEILKRRGH